MRLPKNDFATFVFAGSQPSAQNSGWVKRLWRKSLYWLLMAVLLSSVIVQAQGDIPAGTTAEDAAFSGSVAPLGGTDPGAVTTGVMSGAEAMRSIATAIESGLSGVASGSALRSIGYEVFFFLVIANVVWMLIKAYVSGGGLFNGFIADLIPFGVTAAIVMLFLDRDVANIIKETLDVIGNAVTGGSMGTSLSSTLTGAGAQAFDAVNNIWSVRRATTLTWNPATWLAVVPALLYDVLGSIAATFFVLVALGIFMANLVISQISILIAFIFAPLMVPFLLLRPASFLFDGWLRFFLGALLMKIIGLLMLRVTSSILAAMVAVSARMATANIGGVASTLGIDVVVFGTMILLAGICAMLMASVPSLAAGLLSGNGGTGFSSWSNLTTKSPTTKAIVGGMGSGGGGGGASKRPANALSGMTAMMPNILKPATAGAGSAMSYAGGRMLAASDRAAAAKGAVTNGQRVIGRDTGSMTSTAAATYMKRMEAANARMTKTESGAFYGPPSPRYAVEKPLTSTTPRAQKK